MNTTKLQAVVERLVAKPLFWILAIGLIFSYPVVRAVTFDLAAPLPVLGELPEFHLVDEQGQPFSSDDVKGKAWVADFIFTRCPTMCPAMTEKMTAVQHRSRNLGNAFHIVSFSIDPEFDTPAVLAAYAQEHKASPRMWTFVTGGSTEAIEDMVKRGFKIAVGREGDGPDGIYHGNHFVLIDPKMQIRGYYDPSDDSAIDKLLRDTGLLIAREGAPAMATR